MSFPSLKDQQPPLVHKYGSLACICGLCVRVWISRVFVGGFYTVFTPLVQLLLVTENNSLLHGERKNHSNDHNFNVTFMTF